MTSAPVRDQLSDHLLTPQNAALVLIDYQPSQLAAIRSMDRDLLLKNAVSVVRTIKTFGIPVVHSTVNVASGRGKPTLPELADLLTDDKPIDRTTVNSWEDIEFVAAVHATGGTSIEAHRAGLDRVIQAGGQPVSWVSLAVELQRDWARLDTVAAIYEIVLTDRLLKEE
jgi:nicotinamidase-related amidase